MGTFVTHKPLLGVRDLGFLIFMKEHSDITYYITFSLPAFMSFMQKIDPIYVYNFLIITLCFHTAIFDGVTNQKTLISKIQLSY